MRIGGPLPSPPLYGREYGPLPSQSARRTGECSPPEAQKHIKCFL